MNRNTVLDFLRFIGVSLTLFRHLLIPEDVGIQGDILMILQRAGWIGVDLFFVLSGFLVSGLIFKESQKHNSFSPKNFLIRRGFKIYPSYFLFLLFCLGLSLVKSNYTITRIGFLSELFFLSNYINSEHSWLWSIAVEEHFYFALSLILFCFIKKGALNAKNILITYMFFLVLGFAFRLYNYISLEQFDWFKEMTKSHFRFDSLFFGVLLSFFYNYHNQHLVFIARFKWLILVICLAYLSSNFIFAIEENRWMALFSLSLNPICFGITLILLIDNQSLNRSKYIKYLSYVGKYSYPIYLFHGMIHLVFLGHHFGKFWFYWVGYFVSAVAFGIIFSKVIEYPFLRWRDRYFPSRQ